MSKTVYTVNLIKQYILSLDSQVIAIDDVLAGIKTKRAVVVTAMKELATEGRGWFVTGRRGGKSRFAKKHVSPVAAAIAKALSAELQKHGLDAARGTVLDSRHYESKFSRQDIYDAFTLMQNDGIGTVVHDSGHSLFEIGKKVLPETEVVQPTGFRILTAGTTAFMLSGVNGYDTLSEAIDNSELAEACKNIDMKNAVEEVFARFGFVCMESSKRLQDGE